MLYGFYHSHLHLTWIGHSLPHYLSATVEMPIQDVQVSTAISGLALGQIDGASGWGASYIKSYGRQKDDGTFEYVTLPPNAVENVLYIPRCGFVEFRVGGVQVDLHGQMTILVLSPPHDSNVPTQNLEAFELRDEQNVVLGSHTVSLLATGSRAKLDDWIHRAKDEIARERQSNPGLIKVIPITADSGSNKFVSVSNR